MDIERMWNESSRRSALWGISWPGHPRGAGAEDGPAARSLTDEPERWKMVHASADPEADYSYDDLALMERDDGTVALVRTTGCSCPSPDETWGVIAEGDREAVCKAIESERASWLDGVPRGPFADMGQFVEAWRHA